MGIGVARLGDVGEGNCSAGGHESDPYKGKVITTSQDVFTDGLGTAYLTSIVESTCGHTGRVITVSQTVFVDGLGTAYLSSEFEGQYYNGRIISASQDVFTG